MKHFIIVRYNWWGPDKKDDYCTCNTRMEAVKLISELYKDSRYKGCLFDIEERVW